MQSIPDQLYGMAALLPDAIAEGHLISVTRLEVRLSAPLGNLSATLGDDAANQQLNNRRGLLFRQECPPSRCGTRGIVSNFGRASNFLLPCRALLLRAGNQTVGIRCHDSSRSSPATTCTSP